MTDEGRAGAEGSAAPAADAQPELALAAQHNSVRRSRRDPERAASQMYVLPYRVQEFFIPVWGGVRLTASEVRVVNHPAFARLADIYQLGQTCLVYRGATHKRWEHALGTLEAADLMARAIRDNHHEAEVKQRPRLAGQWLRSEPLRDYEIAFVRLAALLHDIGHVAAGHTFEDELGLLEKHDADRRLTYVLRRKTWRGVDAEKTLGELIDAEYADAAAETGYDLSASEILLHIVSKSRLSAWDNGSGEQMSPLASSTRFRLKVCRDIVGNTICADLLDYIQRDWHHLGKERQLDRRLLEYFEIREDEQNPADARMVVNLRGAANFRADAVTAIFELLESRYQLGEIALFHRTKVTASAMLERLVAEVADAAGGPEWLQGQLDRLLECTDEELLELLAQLGRTVADQMGAGVARDRLLESLSLARALRCRQLHRQVLAFKSSEVPNSLEFIRRNLGGAAGAARRLENCRALEEDFRLPHGSVVIYCLARVPHAKIAGVQVLADERLDALSTLDGEENDPARTSGLLSAQLRRFEGLWRVQVSVAPTALRRLADWQVSSAFERAIEALVLRSQRGSASAETIAVELAQSLVANAAFNTAGKTLVADLHARGAALRHYASGAPTLSGLMQDAG